MARQRSFAAMESVSGLVVLVLVAVAVAGIAAGQQSAADDDRARPVALLRKRSLVYPAPSTLLLIFGLGTPLQLERESVIVGAFAKMLQVLPSNSTDPTQYATRTRSRWSLYRSLGQLAQLYGFGEGRACVLRGICEAAAAPFERGLGLLHQLLQTFLSPSSSREQYDEYADREYHAAERLGRRDAPAPCHALYPECRSSLLDVFSATSSALHR